MSIELEIFRDYRNGLLRQSDWTVMPDSPFSDSKQADWKSYRQSFRDLTKTAKPKVINTGPAMLLDMSSVTFPTKPS